MAIDGTSGNDPLSGTSGNDTINGLAGDDTISAGTGVDSVDGGSDWGDRLVLTGNYASYAITRPDAAHTRFVNAGTGEDVTATNIEEIQFADGLKSIFEVRRGTENIAPTFSTMPAGVWLSGDPVFDQGGAVAIDASGRIYQVSSVSNGGDGFQISGGAIPQPAQDIKVTRLLANGSVDTSFGTNGSVVTPVGPFSQSRVATLDSNGQLVVAGYAIKTSGTNAFELVVVRYNTDGSLDTGFGGDGIAETSVGTRTDQVRGVFALPAGKMIVSGYTQNSGGDRDWVLVKYNADGTLDSSFGTGGKVVTDVGSAHLSDQGQSVIALGDGSILVWGTQTDNNTGAVNAVVGKYTSAGAVDTTFGTAGFSSFALNTSDSTGTSFVYSLTATAAGKILITGSENQGGGHTSVFVARLDANGSFDATFTGGGSATGGFGFSIGEHLDNIYKVIEQPDGKILIAGYSGPTADVNNGVLLRLNTDGSLDTSFGNGGAAYWPYSDSSDGYFGGMALQADGRIVVSGVRTDSPDINSSDSFAMRFNSDGTIDTSFNVQDTLAGTFVAGAGLTVDLLRGHARVTDADLSGDGNYAGATLSVHRDGGAVGTDIFGGDGPLSLSGGNAFVLGVNVGTYTSSGGTFTINFAGTVSAQQVNRALNHITWQNSSVSAGGNPAFAWSFDDGSGAANAVVTSTSALSVVTVASSGTSGDDVLQGTGSNDTLDGKAGNDLVYGLGGNDSIVGGTGDDSLVGAAGNDTISAGTGVDTVDGGTGTGDRLVLLGNFDGSYNAEIVTANTIRIWNPTTGEDIQASNMEWIQAANGALKSVYDIRNNLALENNQAPVFGNAPAGVFISGDMAWPDMPGRVALHGDGSISVLGGVGGAAGSGALELWKFHADGTRDIGYAGDGRAITALSGEFQPRELAVQSDDKVIAAGWVTKADGNFQLALLRYTTAGALDGTFGNGGIVTTAFAVDDRLRSIDLQSDGKIIAGGQTQSGGGGSSRDNLLVRYNTDGSIDNTFGTAGKVVTGTGGISDIITNVKVLADNSIVTWGTSQNGGTGATSTVLTHYTANGALDAAFGTGGSTATAIANFSVNVAARSLAVQADGKFVTLAMEYNGVNHPDGSVGASLVVQRFNANGSIDTTFNGDGDNDGRISLAVATFNNLGWRVLVDANGKILVAIDAQQDGEEYNRGALVRLNSDGSLDTSFGNGGVAWSPFTDPTAGGFNDVKLDASGNIVVVSGYAVTDDPNHSDTVMLRFTPNGVLDTTFSPAEDALARKVLAPANGVAFVNLLYASGGVFDTEHAATDNYGGTTLTVQRHGGAVVSDLFAADSGMSFSGGHVTLDGRDIGTVTNGGGVLTISFNSNATAMYVGGVMDLITWKNNIAAGSTLQFDWTFDDGSGAANSSVTDTSTVHVVTSVAPGGTTGGDDVVYDNSASNSVIDGQGGDDLIFGLDGNDTLIGNTGNDTLNGNAGADTFRPGAGDDSVDGGDITDRINYTDRNILDYSSSKNPGITTGVYVDLSGIAGDGSLGRGIVHDGQGGIDTVALVNFIVGSDFNDSLVGSSAGVFEQFEGGKGNDYIDGGMLRDTLNGTDNNRANFQNASAAEIVDLGAGTATGGDGNDTLVNINHVRGSAFDDSITGSNRSDVTEQFEGGAGKDTINGLGGFDIVRYDNASAAVNVNLANGTASDGFGTTDTLQNIEGIRGSAFNDTLVGGLAANGTNISDGKSEVFLGGAGNDSIDGGQGYDRVDYTTSTTGVAVTFNDTAPGTAQDGLGGVDTLVGIEGVRGSAFGDTLTGSNAGFESFEGREGNDIIDGKGGTDRADYGASTSGVNVNLQSGVALDGMGGTDTLSNIENVRGTRDFSDSLTGSDANNLLQGQGGDDTIHAGNGSDTLQGGDGQDSLDGGSGDDWVSGDAGDNFMQGGDGYDWADYSGAKFAISADMGKGSVAHTDGGDTIAGFEAIRGSGFSDSLVGGDADDQFVGGLGNDTIDGGGGQFNAVAYWDATFGVNVNLATGVVSGASGSDSLSNIQNVYGTSFNDTIVGTDGDNNLNGGLGDDSINGGLGTQDWTGYYDSTAGVIVTLATGVVTGGGGKDTLAGIENVSGGSFNDSIVGTAGDNGLRGEAGNDTLNGGDGSDFITGGSGNDSIIGGLNAGGGGGDTADYFYSDSSAGINVTLLAGAGTVTGGGGTDTLSGIENISATNFDDTIVGDANANFIQGFGGNDSINGGAGADFIDAGGGVDTVDGGADNDTLNLHNAYGAYVITALGNGDVRLQTEGENITIRNVENVNFNGDVRSLVQLVGGVIDGPVTLNGGTGADTLIGGNFNDVINGNAGNDTLIGNDGDDFITGGAGNDSIVGGNHLFGDTANYNDGSATAGVVVNLLTGSVTGGAGVDTLSGIENIQGSQLADNITGSAGNNFLAGNAGNDTINAGDGDDYVSGGAGNDSLVGGNGFDGLEYGDATAGVTVNLGTGAVTGGGGTDIVSGFEFVNGSTFGDTIIGSTGDNRIDGNAGNDSLVGGGGNDIVSYANASGSVTVNLGTGVVTGAEGNDTLGTGSNGFRSVDGSWSNDTLVGDGNDNNFNPNGGDDSVDGGAGTDSVSYFNATAGVNVNLVSGVVTGGSGNDTLVSIESASGSRFNDVITGTSGNNYINGDLGSDTIDGGAGFDNVDYGFATAGVSVNLASGAVSGGENDSLTGIEGLGGSRFNDTFVGAGTDDGFNGGQGDDWIDGGGGTDGANYFDALAGVTANLSTGVVTGGAGNDTLTAIENLGGSSFNDILTGDIGSNQLRGEGGNDTIDGGSGSDYITGGAGNDSIIGGSGIDTADYFFTDTSAAIVVNLTTGAVTGGGGTDTLSGIENVNGSNFNDSITGDDANGNFLEGRDGNDTLTGLGGNDKLDGGFGNDSLVGGQGNDTLIGNNGNDTLIGNEGADVFNGPGGSDSIDGGLVLDRVNYSDGNSLVFAGWSKAVNVNLSGFTGDGSGGTGTADDGLGGVSTLKNVQFITGSGFDDTIVGSSARIFEQFEGGAGNDTIDGGAITDLLNGTNSNRANYSTAAGAVTVDLQTNGIGSGTASGAAGNDVLLNINQLRGGNSGDTFYGSDRTDMTEQFEGRGGDDLIDGRGGFDVIRYDTSTAGVTVNLVTGKATGDLGNDSFSNIEGVFGGSGNDWLIGGNTANGVVVGDGGTEIFRGGAGNDTIDGGVGYDRVDYNNNGVNTGGIGANVTLGGTSNGSAIDGQGGTDTLINIEGVRGSDFADTLTGSDSGAFESFEGLAGADIIDGKGGLDRVDYSKSTAGVNVNLVTKVATDGWGSTDSLSNIEWVRGSSNNDTMTGTAADETFEGFGGSDTIDGGTAPGDNDTLVLKGNQLAYVVTRTATDTILSNGVTGETLTVRNIESFQFADGTKTLSEVLGNSLSPFADNYVGTEGPDSINGLDGNDTLSGLGGDDTIDGGKGDDVMSGGTGNDLYFVDSVKDVVTESDDPGIDTVNVGFGTAGLTYTLGANVENANVTGALATHITGNDSANILIGNAGSNTLFGKGGDDRLDGGTGTAVDSLVGGTGNDTYVIDVAGDVVNETLEGGANDIDTVEVKFASGVYTLAAGIENATLIGATPTAALGAGGNALNNTLKGNDAANVMSGGLGNDLLFGNGGNDSLSGNEGADGLQGGAGNDTIDGGLVTDRINYRDWNHVSYDTSTAGIVMNLSGITGDGSVGQGSVLDGLGGTDVVKNVQYIGGSNFNDSILGSSANIFEMYEGIGGDDTIDGGTITNYLINGNRVAYQFSTDAVTVDLAVGKDGWQHASSGGAGNDLLKNFNQVRGSDFNDSLYGSDREDMPEIFEGMGGNNTIDGRGGFDYVRYSAMVSADNFNGVTVDLGKGTASGSTFDENGDTVTYTDSFVNVEGVQGSNWDDTLLGGSAADTEVFRGNGGWDSIDGGSGFDMVDYTTSDKGVTVNLATGTAQDGWTLPNLTVGTDTLKNIEAVRASDFADSLVGSNADFEMFEGRAGNDTIDGNGGFADEASYSGSTSAVTVDLTNTFGAGGTAKDGFGTTDLLKNITDVAGSRFNDSILGSATSNYLIGLDGNDTINASGGNDTVDGGAGNDSINGDAGDDVIQAGSGVDTVDGGDSVDFDTLVLQAAYGDGTAYSISRVTATDTLVKNVATGETITVRDVESFMFTDTTKTLAELFATSLDNFDNNYTGSEGDDTIDGKDGNDTLIGLGGNDVIIGGKGNDTMLGGAGDDTYTVDNLADAIMDDSGHDSLVVSFLAAGTYNMGVNAVDVEDALVTGALVVHVIGNALDNQITGNTASQSLSGGDGDDSLIGGGGTDTLIGGLGNDTFTIDAATDVIIETPDKGSGLDEVKLLFAAAATYTIAANVENATIANNTLVTITGNDLDNTITGNDGNNVLNGGKGNDTFNAGKATGTGDTLDGGADSDTVNMLAAFSSDYVSTRVNATDTKIVNAVTGEIVVLRNVEAVHFADDTIKSMNDLWGNTPSILPDALVGTEGNDSIDGLAGNDTITGLGGNDTLVGGVSGVVDTDSLIGGQGDDTYRVNSATDVIVEVDGEGHDNVTMVAAGTFNMLTNAKNVEDGFATAGTLVIHIVGNELANQLTGNSGANSLTGGEGNDTLQGNAGTDTLVGGTGDDTYILDATTDLVNETLNGGGSNDTVLLRLAGPGTYTLTTNVENGTVDNATSGVNITGNASNNTLTGNAGNNVLNGLAGNDTIVSGGGNDTVDGGVDSDTLVLAGVASDWVITRPVSVAQTVFSKLGSTVTVTNVEFVKFGDADAVAIGDLTAQIGSPGPDSLSGGDGGDTLDGGAGNDTLVGNGGDDMLLGGTGLGADSLIGGAGNDYLDGGDGADTYVWTFGDGDDVIVQNDIVSTTDKLVLTGVTSDQVTFTRGGFTYNDLVVTIQQGADDDATFESITVADFFDNDAVSKGTIDQVVAQGSNTTYSQTLITTLVNDGVAGGNGGDVFVFFENGDAFSGSGGADWIMAGAGNDTMSGDIGDDTIFGGIGNDSLSGDDDSDLLVGGAGADTLAGGAGDDVLSGGAGNDVYQFGLNGGHDIIRERLNATPDQLESGIGPVYVVTDGDSPSTTETDTLQFGAGIAEADVRATRNGDNLVLTVLSTDDSVTVAGYFANGVLPIEKVQFSSGVTWNATQIRAKVLLSSDGNDSITGYLGGEKLNGGAGDDTIDGGGGNDTVNGGQGSDVLTGGKGNDRFVLADNDGSVDTITDFTLGADTIAISNLAFAGIGTVGQRITMGDSDVLTYDSSTGELSYDADGSGGAGEAVVIAIIGTADHPELGNVLIVA